MKIIVIGATGTIGQKVTQLLTSEGHEVVKVGRKSGDFQVDTSNPKEVAALYKKLGSFEAVAVAAGDVAFAPLESLTPEQFNSSLQTKLMSQVHLVQEALPYIKDKGSFTLVSGILGQEFIQAGTVASMINSAIEGYAKSAACELPKGLRINVVSPSVLEESLGIYGAFFPGFKPVAGAAVAQAYKKSIFGVQTGQVFEVR